MLMLYFINIVKYQYLVFNMLNFNKRSLIILNIGAIFSIQNKFEIKNSFIKQKYVSCFLSFLIKLIQNSTPALYIREINENPVVLCKPATRSCK